MIEIEGDELYTPETLTEDTGQLQGLQINHLYIEQVSWSHALMSGLETVASIVAVLTISCQVISALHNAIKELGSLPKELRKLTSEITIIEQCVAHIIVLIKADDETFKVFQRFRFAEAIGICADTCQEFHRSFSKWASSPTKSRRAQAKLWFHRKDVQSVRAEISSARETTIFTAVSVQL